MTQLHPYLSFNGNCREAMDFYQTCLGGELTFMTIGESPMAAQSPPETHKNIMHASLMKDGNTLLYGSDMMGKDAPKQGNVVSLTLTFESKKEIEEVFGKLSANGKVGQALKEEFFGVYGDFVDVFGMRWMCMFDPKAKKGGA